MRRVAALAAALEWEALGQAGAAAEWEVLARRVREARDRAEDILALAMVDQEAQADPAVPMRVVLVVAPEAAGRHGIADQAAREMQVRAGGRARQREYAPRGPRAEPARRWPSKPA